ncbi:MAG TPA: L,D-transpeptidase [Candidatus Paceibacterota bacterium]|nr:L,D-transpeptidase [Candidatus Paceibacterota bacterium]
MHNAADFPQLPAAFHDAVERCGVQSSEHVLWASVHQQQLFHFQQAGSLQAADSSPTYLFRRNFLISTSRFGIGQESGSNRTPLGLHRVAEKIGAGWPAGTVFKAREPIGFTWKGMPDAKITTRILWLDGLEPGLNRGGNVDSHARFIYIHGVGDETTIGRPASCGCIHLASKDLIPLFNQVPSGTLVWIEE